MRSIKQDIYDIIVYNIVKPWLEIFDWTEARSGIYRLKQFCPIVMTVIATLSTWLHLYDYKSPILSYVNAFSYPAYIVFLAQQNMMADERNRTDKSTTVLASSIWFYFWLIYTTLLIVKPLVWIFLLYILAEIVFGGGIMPTIVFVTMFTYKSVKTFLFGIP